MEAVGCVDLIQYASSRTHLIGALQLKCTVQIRGCRDAPPLLHRLDYCGVVTLRFFVRFAEQFGLLEPRPVFALPAGLPETPGARSPTQVVDCLSWTRGALRNTVRLEAVVSFSLDLIPEHFRTDLKIATEVLRSLGAQEVYVFGSLADPSRAEASADIDLAVSGLPPEKFFRSYGELLGLLDHPFDLVDLDVESRFVRKLRERGHLARVA
ncbi:MAG: nucleotidyltransferase domain-containing protein [Spirochaetaceae bacterium]|nr:MAG: nucleotidyltransferase domain-containing protein [Spirochaetaceae bacterium]